MRSHVDMVRGRRPLLEMGGDGLRRLRFRRRRFRLLACIVRKRCWFSRRSVVGQFQLRNGNWRLSGSQHYLCWCDIFGGCNEAVVQRIDLDW